MRILHLLDPANCGDEGILACAALQNPEGNAGPTEAVCNGAYPTGHETWLLGAAADERRVWSLGIPTANRIHPRRTALGRIDALSGLRRLWNAHRDAAAPDIIQCWSLDALRLARACFGPTPRVALIPRPPLDARSYAPASDLELASGREVIGAFDLATRAALAPLIGHPADAPRWLPAIRLLDPPAFPHGGPIALSRAALREALGLSPTDIALAWLADPPSAIDALHVAYSAGVLHAAGHRTISLIRRGARQERRAAHYLRGHARRWGLLLVDLSLPELLAASDVCVIDAPVPCGPIAASLALSMAIPIAAARDTFLSDPSAQWPAQPSISTAPGRIAVPIAAILEVPSLRVTLASAARAWCDRARARDGFRTTLHDLWAECAPLPAPRISLESSLVPTG